MSSLPLSGPEKNDLPDLHLQGSENPRTRIAKLQSLWKVLLIALGQAHLAGDQRQIEQRRREVKRVTKLIAQQKRLLYLEPYQRLADLAFQEELAEIPAPAPTRTSPLQIFRWVRSLQNEVLKRKKKNQEK